MLQQDGSISFVDEVLALLGDLLAEYEHADGAPHSELEKGLILTYALGVLRCDLCAVGDALAKSPVFRSLHPQRIFEECCGDPQAPQRAERLERIQRELEQRGWPGGRQDSSR